MAYDSYYKVLWQEGMLVGPHHFQQWDHYHEATLELRVRHLIPYSWGVIRMEANPDQFNNCRIFELTSFRGVFPSGMVVNVPCGDPIPGGREMTAQLFTGMSLSVPVYLALPLQPSFRTTNGCPPTSNTMLGDRYIPTCVGVPDENSGQNELDITVARKNLRVLFGNEPGEGYERLKIAELMVKDGMIALNDAYIPPCLILSASPRLQSILDGFIHELARRLNPVENSRRRVPADGMLWLLSQASGLLAILKHFQSVRAIHPEVIYRSLVQFIGQLGFLYYPSDITASLTYDHENLANMFGQVESALYLLLEMMDRSLEEREVGAKAKSAPAAKK